MKNIAVLIMAMLIAWPARAQLARTSMGGSKSFPPSPASPVIGRMDEYKLGVKEWAGAPTPDIDVVGNDYLFGATTWPNSGATAATFTKGGTPAPFMGTPFYPDGYSEARHNGAGGFSDTNTWTLSGAANVMDRAGEFTVCILFGLTGYGSGNPRLMANGSNAMARGWEVALLSSSGTLMFGSYDGTGASQRTTSNAAQIGGVNVFCSGRHGTEAKLILNGSFGTAGPAKDLAANWATYLGRGAQGGTSAPNVILYEVLYTSTPASNTFLTSMSNSAMSCRSSIVSVAATCFPEDEGTLTHVTFSSASEIIDTKSVGWAKAGNMTVAASSYLWPNLRTPLALAAVSFDGNADYFEAGDVGDSSTNLTVAAVFKPTRTANEYLIGKYAGTGGDSSYTLYNGGAGTWFLRVCSAPSVCSSSNGVTPTIGTWNVIVGSYTFVGPGTSVLNVNLNGTEAATASNAPGPIANSATPLKLGSTGVDALAGEVARATVWTNWSASAQDRSKMFAGMAGLLATKPVGTVLPFTRADSGFVCPVRDDACFWVGAGIPEIDRRGIWVGGSPQASNKIIYSNDLTGGHWTQRAGNPVTLTYSATGGPDGGGYTSITNLGAPNTADLQTTAAGFTTGIVGSVYMRRTTSQTGTVRWANGTQGGSGGEWQIDLSKVSTSWDMLMVGHQAVTVLTPFSGATGGVLMSAVVPVGGPLGFDIAGVYQQDAAVLGKLRVTSGSAYAGPATTHHGIPPRVDEVLWTNAGTRSEEIELWTGVSNMTRTPNATIARDGSFTMDKIANTANGSSYVANGFTATAERWSAEFDALAGSTGLIRAGIYQGAFVPQTMEILSGPGTVAGDYLTPFYVTGLSTTTPTRIKITTNGPLNAATAYLYAYPWVSAGYAGDSVYLTRVQIHSGVETRDYCPTLSVASTCGSSGGLGRGITNYVYNSENMVPWSSSGIVTKTVDKITESTSAGAEHYIYWPWTATNGTYTVSAEFKAGERGWFYMSPNAAGTGAYFNVSSGAVGTIWGGGTTASIVPVGDSWYRVRVTANLTAGLTSVRIALATGDIGGTYDGDGVSGAYVRNVQLEGSTFAGPYCGPTSTSSKTCVFVERPAQSMAFSVTATPSGAWNLSQDRYLIGYTSSPLDGVGITTQVANTIIAITYNALGGAGYRYANYPVTGSAEKRVLYVTSGDGSMLLKFDGQTVVPTPVGTGSGIVVRAPTTYMTIGAASSGLYPFNGWIKSWASCTRGGDCR